MKQQFTASNGDQVWLEVPDPPIRREMSAHSAGRLVKIKGYRKTFFREHRRAPNADELYGMLRESRGRRA